MQNCNFLIYSEITALNKQTINFLIKTINFLIKIETKKYEK